jgi:hypothetical protein
VHQERLLVDDEELIELDPEVGMEGGDAEDARGDLGGARGHFVLCAIARGVGPPAYSIRSGEVMTMANSTDSARISS